MLVQSVSFSIKTLFKNMSRYQSNHGKGGNSAPDRWLDYTPIGKPIDGTRFVAFKVPLSKDKNKGIDDEKQLYPELLLSLVPNLGLVIDLTFTTKYYNPKEFTDRNVDFLKIFVEGHKMPSKKNKQEFADAVDDFIEKNLSNNKLIGVHCTHGLNRTGFMVCEYMIRHLKFSADSAIKAFELGRGHKMERDNYIAGLRSIEDGFEQAVDDDDEPNIRTRSYPREYKPLSRNKDSPDRHNSNGNNSSKFLKNDRSPHRQSSWRRSNDRSVEMSRTRERDDMPRPQYDNRNYDNRPHERGDRPNYNNRPQERDERPYFNKHQDRGGRSTYQNRRPQERGERPTFVDRKQERGDRPNYTNRSQERNDRPNYNSRPNFMNRNQDRGDRPNYNNRGGQQERGEYRPRGGGFSRPRQFGDRNAQPFEDRSQKYSDRVSVPYEERSREGGNRPPPFNGRPRFDRSAERHRTFDNEPTRRFNGNSSRGFGNRPRTNDDGQRRGRSNFYKSDDRNDY